MSAQLPERRWARAYNRELALMLLCYAIVLVAALIGHKHSTGALRIAITLAPMIPFSGLPFIVVRSLAKIDERERSLIYRALTFAFFGTALLTFAYGFLELAGAPPISMFSVWPLMAVLWIVGRWVAPRMP